MKKDDGFTDKYWICDSCAKSKGWVSYKTGNTVIFGKCGHCESEKETILIPTRDFRKPREK